MLFKNISLGVYYPGDSLLHRLQARTKLLLLLALVVALVIAGHSYWDFTPYLVAFALVLLGVACSGIGWREIGRRIWLLLLIVSVSSLLALLIPFAVGDGSKPFYILPTLVLSGTFLLGGWLLLGGLFLAGLAPRLLSPYVRGITGRVFLRRIHLVAVWSLLFYVPLFVSALFFPIGTKLIYMITYDSFWYTGIFLLGFLILYPLSLLLTMTTSPIALIEGLTMLLAPLRKLRLPVDDFALMTLLALRFVPTLIEEIEHLVRAQAARGATFRANSLGTSIKNALALIIPFMRNTLRRAADLAIALEARGYQVTDQQTRLHETKLSWRDYLALLFVCGLLLSILLR